MYDLFRRRQKKKTEDKLTIVMSFIAAEVKKKSCDELSRLRFSSRKEIRISLFFVKCGMKSNLLR